MAKTRKVGSPWDPDVVQGPQVDKDSYEKVLEMIEAGKAEGAKLQCGGKSKDAKGYFIQPTVFSDVPFFFFLIGEVHSTKKVFMPNLAD